MTSRSDVSELITVSARATELASIELDSVFRSVGMGDPQRARDALVELYPVIGKKYGSVVSTAYGQWFEAQRMAQTGAPGRASLTGVPSIDEMAGTVRYAAKFLFEGNPSSALSLLQGALQRHVTDSGRNTIYDSSVRDALRPRFGRVPSGGETCSFCFMLASRGFVYASQDTAGASRSYHDHCNCQIVPEWKPGGARIEGYNPDAMYVLYRDARRSAKSKNPKDILAEMRAKYSDMLTDGHGKSKISTAPKSTPDPVVLRPLGEAEISGGLKTAESQRSRLEKDQAREGFWSGTEQESWDRYTGYGFENINGDLRNPGSGASTNNYTPAMVVEDIANLDNLITKSTLTEETVMVRGFGVSEGFDPRKLAPGELFADPGFLSASTRLRTAEAFKRNAEYRTEGWLTYIRAPQGTHAIAGFDHEKEIILGRGTIQRVVEVDLDNRILYTEVEQ